MRKERLNFGVIVRVLFSLIPILLGLPTVSVIFCAYNLAMSFIVFGPLTAFVSSLCAVCFSMLFGGALSPQTELSGLAWAVQAILCAAGCVYGIGYKKNFYSGLGLSSLGILVPQFIYTRHFAFSEGKSVAEILVPPLESIKMMTGGMMEQLQEAQGVNQELIDEILETVHRITTLLIPSTLIVTSMVVAYIALWAVSAQLRKLPFGTVHSFSHIKVSHFTVVFAIAAFALNISGLFDLSSLLSMVILNVFVVLIVMCFFAGVSLADFYMRKFIPMTFVRVLIHAMITLNGFPIYIIAAFVDSFANFRKLQSDIKKGGETDETKE